MRIQILNSSFLKYSRTRGWHEIQRSTARVHHIAMMFQRYKNRFVRAHESHCGGFLGALISAAPLLLIGCAKEKPAPIKQETPRIAPAATVPAFNEKRAWADLLKQVAFGPRNPNSKAHDACRDWLASELRKTTDAVSLQDFTVAGYFNEQLRLTNIIASYNPQATYRVLLLAHWDSRPRADMETDPIKKTKPIPAANDAASGVSVLLELARMFKADPPPVGVDILLTDGEDYGREGDAETMYFLGARHFAETKPTTYQPRCGILLDLVGDREAVFAKEGGESMRSAPDVVNLIWRTASELGATHFEQRVGSGISDDHLSLNAAGIPTVDIIDADLVGHRASSPRRKYWHTLRDTPENCSERVMGEVGRVVAEVLYRRIMNL